MHTHTHTAILCGAGAVPPGGAEQAEDQPGPTGAVQEDEGEHREGAQVKGRGDHP